MQRQKKSKKSSRSQGVMLIPKPPPFQSSIQIAQIFRFQSVAAFASTVITLRDLFDILNVALTAVTATQLLQSMRFKRIRIWGPPAAALTPVTVSVEFPTGGSSGGGSISGPLRVWSDTSIGSTECAFIDRKPAKGSFQSLWQVGEPVTNPPFVTISGPAASVVEVHILGVMLLNGGVVSVTNAPVAATAGQVYLRGLDGLAAAGTNFVPLSYPTD